MAKKLSKKQFEKANERLQFLVWRYVESVSWKPFYSPKGLSQAYQDEILSIKKLIAATERRVALHSKFEQSRDSAYDSVPGGSIWKKSKKTMRESTDWDGKTEDALFLDFLRNRLNLLETVKQKDKHRFAIYETLKDIFVVKWPMESLHKGPIGNPDPIAYILFAMDRIFQELGNDVADSRAAQIQEILSTHKGLKVPTIEVILAQIRSVPKPDIAD